MLNLRSLIVFGLGSILLTFIILTYGTSEMHRNNQESPLMDRHNVLSFNKKIRLDDSNDKEIPIFHKDNRSPLNVQRMSQYCNLPHEMAEGEHGLVSKDFRLLAVQTVIRHGDRSPLYRLKQLDKSGLRCVVNENEFLHLPKVGSYVAVMTEASKNLPQDSAFNRWALFPSHQICGEGQLTGQGAVQHIINGMHHARRYLHQHHLFSDSDWEQQYVIHTTEVSRTFQSAIAFTYGFLPKFDFSRLQLYRASGLEFCQEKVFHELCKCPGLDTLRQQSERECKMSSEQFKLFSSLIKHVAEVVDLMGKKIPGPSSLMDAISFLACHSITLPCNSNGTCLTAKAFETVWKLIDAKSQCLSQNSKYKEFAKSSMNGLLYRIARDFEVTAQNGSTPAFHLYSGHDTTLIPLITALELDNNVWPSFAATITFELYRQETKRKHVFRLLRNGKDVTSQVVFCRGRTEPSGMCSLSHFVNYVAGQNLINKQLCNSLKEQSVKHKPL